jgi:hypothetical protein
MVDSSVMRAALVLATVIVLGATSSARGESIALEAYTHDRPPDAPRLLSPILDELAARGFVAGDTLARKYDAQVSRAQGGGLPAEFAAQVDRGFKAWVTGRFDEAIKQLGPLVEAAHANSGAFASDQSLREPLLKALIGVALAQQRTGDPSAMRATFAEIARSFPETQISRATYGPEAYEAYEQVKRELAASGRGRLVVRLGDEAGVVFVDEAYRGAGSSTIELPPGEYRVCALTNKQPSRTHRVLVRENAETVLVIDARLDRAVRTGGWTGFAFGSDGERETQEAAFAAGFANAIHATAVAVVGIEQVKGRGAIVGSLVSLQTGREIRRASVAMDPDPSTERLRALARFLAGDEPAAGLDVQVGAGIRVVGAAPITHPGSPASAAEPPARDAPTARWGGYRWIFGGLGLASLSAGGVSLALDGRCKGATPIGRPCNDLYQTATQGYVLLGAGGLFAVISIYLFTHDGAPASRTAFVAPTSGGAIAGLSARW